MKLKTEKQQRKINETKSVLCKVNTIDKPLVRLTLKESTHYQLQT